MFPTAKVHRHPGESFAFSHFSKIWVRFSPNGKPKWKQLFCLWQAVRTWFWRHRCFVVAFAWDSHSQCSSFFWCQHFQSDWLRCKTVVTCWTWWSCKHSGQWEQRNNQQRSISIDQTHLESLQFLTLTSISFNTRWEWQAKFYRLF